MQVFFLAKEDFDMLKTILTFILGSMAGGTLGVVMMCLFITAGNEERALEKRMERDKNA